MPGVYTPGEPQLLPSAMTGSEQIPVDTQLPQGVVPATAYITTGGAGLGMGIQTVIATGATLGQARSVVAGPAMIFVSASTSSEGIKLPTVTTGARYTVVPAVANGVKVYPQAAGQKIGAATTATTATTVTKAVPTTFWGLNATTWLVK